MVPAPKKEEKKAEKEGAAKLIIDVPADAKLYIDDQPMKTESARRTFSTPALQKGQAYFYDVRVEVVRDGKTYSDSKRVIVRAGELAQATFAGTADLYGAIIANKVSAVGTFQIHYDNSLQNGGWTASDPMMTAFSWKKY